MEAKLIVSRKTKGTAMNEETTTIDTRQIDPDGPAEIRPVPDARDALIAELQAEIEAMRAASQERTQEDQANALCTMFALADLLTDGDRARAVARAAERDVAWDGDHVFIEQVKEQRGRHLWALRDLVSTSGLPPVWRRVLAAAAEGLAQASSEYAVCLLPDAPGALTNERVAYIADKAAGLICAELIHEFTA